MRGSETAINEAPNALRVFLPMRWHTQARFGQMKVRLRPRCAARLRRGTGPEHPAPRVAPWERGESDPSGSRGHTGFGRLLFCTISTASRSMHAGPRLIQATPKERKPKQCAIRGLGDHALGLKPPRVRIAGATRDQAGDGHAAGVACIPHEAASRDRRRHSWDPQRPSEAEADHAAPTPRRLPHRRALGIPSRVNVSQPL